MRQLGAIMFSDMFGYTALMQQNEQLANAKRRRLKEVLEASVSAYNGKILQYYGDGALSMFNSAIDGVNCAVEIQQALEKEPKVDLRIGLYTGDITIEHETIYGDGRDAGKGKTKQPANRLAVLPFVNISADPENEYFSDGITEEVHRSHTKHRLRGLFPLGCAYANSGENRKSIRVYLLGVN